MKKVVLIITVLLAINMNSQEVKNQTEQIKTLKIGKYLTYDLNSKGKWYPIKLNAELISVAQEKNFPEHKYVSFKVGSMPSEIYVPTNMAFPITLKNIPYEGNEKLQKKIGYVPVEVRPGSRTKLVVLNGIIAQMSIDFNPEDEGTYETNRLYVHESFVKGATIKKKKPKKKKKLSFFKKMMTVQTSTLHFTDAGAEKLADMNIIDKLRKYLKEAYAKQQEIYPTWASKKENKIRLKNIKIKRELVYKAIRNYNKALMNTPEWKRIQENNKFWEKQEAKNNTTIKNNTGRDIYIYEEGSHNGERLSNNSSGSYKCNNTYYYSFSGNASWRDGKRISGTNCGVTAIVK